MIYYAPIARLLGDLVVSLPPLQTLIERGNEVCLVLRSKAQDGIAERIGGLHSFINEHEFLSLNEREPQTLINLRDHPLQRDYVWGSPDFQSKYPGYKIDDIIRKICADFGIADGQDSLKPLQFISKEELNGKIVLIPGTAGPIKRWTTSNWLDLYERLKAERKDVVLIGEPRIDKQVSGLMKLGIPWVPTPELSDAIDVVSSAAAVVAVDTGLMHLAAHQGIKTVGIMRQNNFFARKIPNARYLTARSCAVECTTTEFNFTPNASVFYKEADDAESIFAYWTSMNCQIEERCMTSISVDHVLAALQDADVID